LTTSFNYFCSSQIALHQGSFYMNLMWGTPLQTQLNDLFNDLEVTYLDLVGEQLWSGVMATPHQSSFLAGNVDDDTEFKDTQAMAAKINLPWDEWLKLYVKCHHCRDKGHICPQCPDYIKKSQVGQDQALKWKQSPKPLQPTFCMFFQLLHPLALQQFLEGP
jgi:hypothetical protein